MRAPDTHDYYCNMLNGPLGSYDSITYGVNRASPLNELKNFHVVSGQLPQDIMHVIYEGVFLLNIRLMLNKFINEDRLFTLEALNDRISSFPHGRFEAKNKPSKLLSTPHLKGTTKLPFSGNMPYKQNCTKKNPLLFLLLCSCSNVDLFNSLTIDDCRQNTCR